jgi:hypothetical protein
MMIPPVLCREETVSLSSLRGLLFLLQIIVFSASILEAGTLAGTVLCIFSVLVAIYDVILFMCQRAKSMAYCECVGPANFHNLEIFIEIDKQIVPL